MLNQDSTPRHNTPGLTAATRGLTGWCSFALAATASAALGCGGGSSSTTSEAVDELQNELQNNEDLQNGLDDLLNSLDEEDAQDFLDTLDQDDIDDLFDTFDDADGNGAPDLPPDLPDEFNDLGDFFPPDMSLVGTFSGSGVGLGACGAEPNIESSSASVTFNFDGDGNATFTVEFVTTSMGNTATITTSGSGSVSVLEQGRLLVTGPATATVSTQASDGIFTNTSDSIGLYTIINADTNTPAFDLCADGSVLIPLSQ
ncbi:MAG: hypothetical protein AAF297_04985 [Planctomycetota bacterium]